MDRVRVDGREVALSPIRDPLRLSIPASGDELEVHVSPSSPRTELGVELLLQNDGLEPIRVTASSWPTV